MDEKLIGELNKFTRREHMAEEVYIFPVTLCDNEVDRDNERFSRKALEEMAERFVGVTGIFDHNPKGENQTARIFMTEIVEEGRNNSLGEPYAYLKGYAYMVRTGSNEDLIREIDGGIKKEVSVSCSAESQLCSVCGADRRTRPCHHIKGKIYDGKRCYFTLEDISDAYEWSFVAVPAQVHAGVTKGFEEKEDCSEKRAELIAEINRMLMLEKSGGCMIKIFSAIFPYVDDVVLEEFRDCLSERGQMESCDEYKM